MLLEVSYNTLTDLMTREVSYDAGTSSVPQRFSIVLSNVIIVKNRLITKPLK